VTRLAYLLAGALLLSGVGVTASLAHPILLASTPEAGSVVSRVPARIVLRFNNRVEKALCRVALVTSGGRATPLDVAAGEGSDAEVVAAMPAIEPGTYKVEWRALSADGHFVSGSFSFRLAP
jgi:methionine-rich copper-binding protein CopC